MKPSSIARRVDAMPPAARRSTPRALISLMLVLGLVAGTLGGCVFVPLGGWGGHGHHGGEYHHH